MHITQTSFALSIFGLFYFVFIGEYEKQNPDYKSQEWLEYIIDVAAFIRKGIGLMDTDAFISVFYAWCLFCLPILAVIYVCELIVNGIKKLSE